MSENNLKFQDVIIQDKSIFELLENSKGLKNIIFNNNSPKKYAALIEGSDLNFHFTFLKPSTIASIFFLFPETVTHPIRINLDIDINQSDCKIEVNMVNFLAKNIESEMSAKIFMDKNIENTAASLLQESIILSEDVKTKSIPILDIHSKNIQASHWAKIYRLDGEKLFYFQSKWLPFNQAKKLILSSYFERLLDSTWLENMKEKYVEEYLS